MRPSDHRGPDRYLETLRRLLHELRSPDLTLARGKIFRRRIRNLLETTGTSPEAMDDGAGPRGESTSGKPHEPAN